MSPQRIRDIQLKSKHLDSEGGKTLSLGLRGLREKRKSRDDYRGELFTRAREAASLNKRTFLITGVLKIVVFNSDLRS